MFQGRLLRHSSSNEECEKSFFLVKRISFSFDVFYIQFLFHPENLNIFCTLWICCCSDTAPHLPIWRIMALSPSPTAQLPFPPISYNMNIIYLISYRYHSPLHLPVDALDNKLWQDLWVNHVQIKTLTIVLMQCSHWWWLWWWCLQSVEYDKHRWHRWLW